jgi:hypothetical protein
VARFTSSANLNIKWANHSFIGTAGTTHRVTDALVEEFVEEVVPVIPGFAWVTQDELTSIVTLPIAQTDVTGLTAALAAKYDKAGGIISGAASVTGAFVAQAAATVGGNFIAQSAATVAGALVAQGSQTVANALTVGGAANLSSTLGVTGAATLLGAVNASSTLGVTGAATLTGKLTLGNVVAMGSTTFPGSPANNDLYYRTDLDLLFFYDGTRWLSTNVFTMTFAPGGGINIAATELAFPWPVPLLGGTDIWLEDFTSQCFVAGGGSALSASHKWVGVLAKRDSASSATTLATHNIDSGSSAVWRTFGPTAIDALLGATYFAFSIAWTKTGTPGALNATSILSYRIVAS